MHSGNNNHIACPGLYHIPQAGDGGLCRIRLEQGQISAKQLRRLGALSRLYGNGMIELTNRANIQLRGIKSWDVEKLQLALKEAKLAPKMMAGDTVRNVMVNPTSGFDNRGDGRILPLAQELTLTLQSHPLYQTLSPKFSIFLDGGEACALIHHRHDIWLSLCDTGKKFAFGLASRPPLENEPPHMLNQALGKVPFVHAQDLIFTLIDILLNIGADQPQITRMKHLSSKEVRDQIFKTLPFVEEATHFRRIAPRQHAHLGIHPSAQDNLFYLGFKPPFGILSPDRAEFIADQADSSPHLHLRLTPWQSLILWAGSRPQMEKIALACKKADFITDATQAAAHIVCCIGAPSCTATQTPIRRDAQKLAQALQGKKIAPIHISGCAKSCIANEAVATTLIAQSNNLYDLFTADSNAPSAFGRLLACSVSIEQAAQHIANSS